MDKTKEIFERVNSEFRPNEKDVQHLFDIYNKETGNNMTDLYCHKCRYKIIKYFRKKYPKK